MRPDATAGLRAFMSRARVRAPGLSGLIVYLGFVLIVLFFSVVLRNKGFLEPNNFLNILRQTTMVSIMAMGMTFVLSAGEIDLSIGSTVALSAMVTAVLIRDSGSLPIAVAGGLSVGALVGLANGLIVTKFRIPSFLVTLGMLGIVSGLARDLTNLDPVAVTDPTYTFIFGSGDVGLVPTLVLWMLAVLLVTHTTYRRTSFGRQVLATGGNRIAARYSGISTDQIRIAVLVISGLTAALAGMLYTGRLQGARYSLGDQDLLTVIAAVVIGGTSMFGGRGSIVGAIVGSLIMGVLTNGLILMGLTVSEQMIARGIIIIGAVALSLREAKEG